MGGRASGAPVEQEYLLATAAVAALLDAAQVEQLAGHLLLGSHDDAVLGQHGEHGACVRDGLHGILDLVEPTLRGKDGGAGIV